MYDLNKTQNIIIKVPWFHTPASNFSQNTHDTMVKITKRKKWRRCNHSTSDGNYFALTLPGIMTKYNIKETASKGNIWFPFYMSKGEDLDGG